MRTILVLAAALASVAPAIADDIVNCHIANVSFYTTHQVCNALVAETVAVGQSVGKYSKMEAVHVCADSLAKRLPRQNRPTYLNQCDAIVSSFDYYHR